MKYEGLSSVPQILTEADILFHCYGVAYEAIKEPTSAPELASVPEISLEPAPAPAPVPEPEPIPEPALVPEPIPEPNDSTPSTLTVEEMTAKLITENSKAALVTKAEQAGIDSSGTKNELAARLASHTIGV
jgi:outer membrane biosynthesis protein TonB